MTIALGILATDGVVIAADTQESSGYPGGAKVAGSKLLTRVVRNEQRSCWYDWRWIGWIYRRP